MAKQLNPRTTEVEHVNNMKIARKKKVIKLTCDFCDVKFKLFKDLENHCSVFHHDREFDCSKCDFKTNCLSRIKLHQKKIHDPKNCLEYTVCGFHAISEGDLSSHYAAAQVSEQEQ